MYKSIMKYLTDKDLSKGFLSMILFNDEINALELLKCCSYDIETIKDTMLELRIMKYVKYNPETNVLQLDQNHMMNGEKKLLKTYIEK